MKNKIIVEDIKCAAINMRQNVLKMAYNAGNIGAHLGPSLSIIEIMAVLYKSVMNIDCKNPTWEGRDRFILSKGHGALGYYTALAEASIITYNELLTFEQNGGFLSGQPSRNPIKGIEYSSGSLGMGLSLGIGVALAAKKQKKDFKVYVLMGNGECNEGNVWEAAISASQFKLDNLIAIIDDNQMQSDGKSSDVMDMGNWEDKWSSFGFATTVVNGHDVEELFQCLTKFPIAHPLKPKMIIAKTIKGRGVSFMENNPAWHHGILTKSLYNSAISELA